MYIHIYIDTDMHRYIYIYIYIHTCHIYIYIYILTISSPGWKDCMETELVSLGYVVVCYNIGYDGIGKYSTV